MDITGATTQTTETTVAKIAQVATLSNLFVLTRQTHSAFKELNIQIDECLDTDKVSDRLKSEIEFLNNEVLRSLLLTNSLINVDVNLTRQELDGINNEVSNYLLLDESSNDYEEPCDPEIVDHSAVNCEFKKYYEITPLNTSNGTILLVIVEEGFLRKVTGSKEDLSGFFSNVLDYMYSIKAPSTIIQPVVQSYLRINNNEDLLTRIKVSLRSPK